MNPDELRTIIAEEISKALKPIEAELKNELKEINAKVEDVKDTLNAKVEDVKDTLTAEVKELDGKVGDVRNEQTRLNAMFEMHIAHTAERKADAAKADAQRKADTAERWKIAAILSAIGFSAVSLLNQIFGWFGKLGN